MRRLTFKNKKGMADSTRALNVTLMMLILAFFIVLNALAISSEKKRIKVINSIWESLGIVPIGNSSYESGQDGIPLSGPPMQSGENEIRYLINRFEDYLALSDKLQFSRLIIEKQGVEIHLESSLLFEDQSSDFKPEAYEILTSLKSFFEISEKELLVESRLPKDKENSYMNLDLSLLRSGKILRWILDNTKRKAKNMGISDYPDFQKALEDERIGEDFSKDKIILRYRLNKDV